MNHATSHRPWRIAAAVVLIGLGLVLAPSLAALAFLAGASLTASMPLLTAAALIVLAAVAWTLTWTAGRLAFPARRRLTAAVLALALTAAAGAAAATTLFRPLDIDPPAGTPAGEYWDLPTGSRIAYDHVPATGEARGGTVVRLHGGPGTPGDGPDDLDRVLAEAGFDVYVYDQAGSGRSERLDPADYTVARQVADLEAIRGEIGADRLVLIGGSWGGTLAAAYAAAHPDHVDRLVFTSPGALWAPEWEGQDEGDLWDRLTPEQNREMTEFESSGGVRLLTWSLLMEDNPDAARALIPDAEIDAVFARLLSIVGSATSCEPGGAVDIPDAVPGFYANQLIAADQLRAPDPRPALAALDAPALVLRGECDYKRWEITREYRDAIPGAELVYFEGAGHSIETDRPDLYTDTVTAFLTGAELPLPAYTGDADPAA